MNPAITAVGGSVIRAIHARRKPTSIDLGLGEPTLRPNVAYFERAVEWVGEHGCRYSSNIGDDDLRELIAAHYAYPSLDNKANVCMTTGSQEAVYLAIKTLLDPARDEVLLVEPAFGVYAKIAQVEGIHLRTVTMNPSEECAFDPERIIAALGPRTRLLVICSPCNPTGRVISKASVAKIAEALLAREGPPVYVLHDEIYRELAYVDDVGEFGKVYPYTIAINSLSKSNALTGLRIGWLIAPRDVMPEIVKMHGLATSCASTFAQRVAFEVFAAKDLHGHTAWYTEQRAGALAAARAQGLPAIVPEGAFYLCLDTGAENTLGFVERLLDESDVVTIPGDIFSPALRGWLRTSFVAPLDDIRRGYERIAELAATLRARPRDGELAPGLSR
jgi:aminotransferase